MRKRLRRGAGAVLQRTSSELAVLLATLTLGSATLLTALTGLIRLVLLSALVAATLLATLVLLVHAFV
jgi:hypothetical protein